MSGGDATLLLLGHGAVKSTLAARPVHWHAEQIRRRNLFQDVLVGFWREPPSIRSAVDQIRTKRAMAVPLFLSEGYFTQQVIPGELGLPREQDGTYRSCRTNPEISLSYSLPVGTHPRMVGVILDAANKVVRERPFPSPPISQRTSLFLVGHGTPRNPNSRRAVERQVERIRELAVYAQVEAVFLEEAPAVAEVVRMASMASVVVVPFFLGDALHPLADIPIQLGESEEAVMRRISAGQSPWKNPTEKSGKRIWYAPGLGMDPVMTEIVLDRAEEARAMLDRA